MASKTVRFVTRRGQHVSFKVRTKSRSKTKTRTTQRTRVRPKKGGYNALLFDKTVSG